MTVIMLLVWRKSVMGDLVVRGTRLLRAGRDDGEFPIRPCATMEQGLGNMIGSLRLNQVVDEAFPDKL